MTQFLKTSAGAILLIEVKYFFPLELVFRRRTTGVVSNGTLLSNKTGQLFLHIHLHSYSCLYNMIIIVDVYTDLGFLIHFIHNLVKNNFLFLLNINKTFLNVFN